MKTFIIIILLCVLFALVWFVIYKLTKVNESFKCKQFAKWIANNAQPLAPNIGREWKLNNNQDKTWYGSCITTEELYEIFKKTIQ